MQVAPKIVFILLTLAGGLCLKLIVWPAMDAGHNSSREIITEDSDPNFYLKSRPHESIPAELPRPGQQPETARFMIREIHLPDGTRCAIALSKVTEDDKNLQEIGMASAISCDWRSGR